MPAVLTAAAAAAAAPTSSQALPTVIGQHCCPLLCLRISLLLLLLLLFLLQGTTNFLSSFANCPYTTLLAVDDSSRSPNAWSNATILCTFQFVGNLGSGSGG
jgi:hypothetical protein